MAVLPSTPLSFLRLGLLLAAISAFAPIGNLLASQARQTDRDRLPAAATPAGAPYAAGFLDCTAFTWMQNCKEVNEWVRTNPEKPLVLHRDGLQFHFPPGTPAAEIDWVVNGTPESLRRYIAYNKRAFEHDTKRRQTFEQYVKANGEDIYGLLAKEKVERDARAEALKINPQNVAVYVFYDSRCPACRAMEGDIGRLQREHPNLVISLLQINQDDPNYPNELRRTHNLRARVLRGEELARYRSQIKGTPTIWIEKKRNRSSGNGNEYDVINGYVSNAELRRLVAEASK